MEAAPSVSRLLSQGEVVVAKRAQLRQAAQQAAKALWSPSCSSTLGPAHPGQQIEY